MLKENLNLERKSLFNGACVQQCFHNTVREVVLLNNYIWDGLFPSC